MLALFYLTFLPGHLWEVAEIRGIVSSVIWRSVSAQASSEGKLMRFKRNKLRISIPAH